MENKIKKIIGFILLVLLISSLFFLVSTFLNKKGKDAGNLQAEKNRIIGEYRDEFLSDYNNKLSQETISKTEKLLNSGTLDKDNEGLAKILLGNAYLTENRIKGLDILTSVVLDQSISRGIRSAAIASIANNYELCPDPKPFIDSVFSGDAFGSFMEKNNISLAFAQLNEYSFQLSPGVVGQYRIAKYYASAVTDKNISKEDKEKYINLAIKSLMDGDKKIQELINKESNIEIGYAYFLKARTFHILKYFGVPSISNEEIEQNYEKSMEYIEKEPQGRYRYFAYYPNIYYSFYLSRIDAKENSNKIIELLQPIVDGNIKQTNTSCLLKKMNSNGLLRIGLDRLETIDPKFKELMAGL